MFNPWTKGVAVETYSVSLRARGRVLLEGPALSTCKRPSLSRAKRTFQAQSSAGCPAALRHGHRWCTTPGRPAVGRPLSAQRLQNCSVPGLGWGPTLFMYSPPKYSTDTKHIYNFFVHSVGRAWSPREASPPHQEFGPTTCVPAGAPPPSHVHLPAPSSLQPRSGSPSSAPVCRPAPGHATTQPRGRAHVPRSGDGLPAGRRTGEKPPATCLLSACPDAGTAGLPRAACC